jgi:bifunctional pyridoxal-dependent enzyme with beta-cystathionase and maltose regulon repressor activities
MCAVVELMEICSKYEVHLIADEVYGLSVYDETQAQFSSVLSLMNEASLLVQRKHVTGWNLALRQLPVNSFRSSYTVKKAFRNPLNSDADKRCNKSIKVVTWS